jgi:hypothetical protein
MPWHAKKIGLELLENRHHVIVRSIERKAVIARSESEAAIYRDYCAGLAWAIHLAQMYERFFCECRAWGEEVNRGRT